MKPRSTARLSFLLAAAIAALFATVSSSTAALTWDNTAGGTINDGAGAWLGTGLWNNAGTPSDNWTSGSDAVFGNGGAGGAVTLASPTTVNSLTLNSFTGTYTLGAATQTITLTNGITKNTGAGAATIISPITLGAAQSWLNNSAGLLTVGTSAVGNGGFRLTLGGTGNTTVSSAISGAGGLTKSDAGISTLSGANTYGGATTINGGVLAAASLANGGTTSNIGNSSNAATNLIFGAPAATLRYTGIGASINRSFTLSSGAGGGATIEASGTGALTFDNTVPIAYGTADQTRTLTLGGTNPGENNFGKALADNGTGASSLVKAGTGTWVLSAANTHTGGSTVSEGALVFRTLAAKSGTGTHAFAAGTTLGLGVGGSNFTTADVDNAFTGTMSGNLSNITVNANTNVGIDTTAGDVAYATNIGSVNKGLTKFGANTLTLSGSSAYTGATTVVGGTLAVAALANAGANSSIGNFATAGATGLTLAGGTLSYTGASTTTDRGFTAIGASQKTISVGTGVNLVLGASVKNETAASTSGLTFSATGASSSITVSSLTIAAGTSPDFNIAGSLPTVTIQNLNVTGNNVIANRAGDTNGTMLNVGNINGTNALGWLAWLNVTGAISGYTGGIVLGNNVTLSGLSSFDVTVALQQGGIYTFNSIKDWGVGASASALGAPTTLANGTIGFGNGINNPTFKYTGSGDTTNRVLNLRGTTGTAKLEQAGTGNLLFTSALTATGGGSKTLELTGSTAGTGELGGAIIDNSVANKTSVSKTGTGTWTLSGVNLFTGTTAVTGGGTLAVTGTGSINTSSGVTITASTLRYNSSTNLSAPLTFTSGKIAGTNWNGSLSGLSIGANQTISPGNSPGTATTAAQTWAGSGSYLWEVNNAAGTAGADPGWDLLSGTGTLDITASNVSTFNILVTSLTLANAAGNATNFSDLTSYNWLIADFASINGFSADKFNINTTGFTNTATGTFGIALGNTVSGGDNTQIYLTYAAIPEPSSVALLGLGGLALLRRRR